MSATDLVVGLVGGGAVGTVFTALIGASHERTERTRERKVLAAETFLTAAEDARQAIADQCREMRALRDASKEVQAEAKGLVAREAELGEATLKAPIPAEWADVLPTTARVLEFTQLGLAEEETESAAAELAKIVEALRGQRENIRSYRGHLQDLAEPLGDLIVLLTKMTRTMPRAFASSRLAREAIDIVKGTRPRLLLVYAEATQVPNHATSVIDALARAQSAALTAFSDPEQDTAVVAAQDRIEAAVVDFARVTAEATRGGWRDLVR